MSPTVLHQHNWREQHPEIPGLESQGDPEGHLQKWVDFCQMPSMDQSLGNSQRRLTEGNHHILLANRLVWAERDSPQTHIIFLEFLGILLLSLVSDKPDGNSELMITFWGWNATSGFDQHSSQTDQSLGGTDYYHLLFLLLIHLELIFFSFYENKRRQKAWNTAPLERQRLCESQWLTLYTYLLLQYQMEQGWDRSALVNIKYHGSYYSATGILQQQQFWSKTFSISHYI